MQSRRGKGLQWVRQAAVAGLALALGAAGCAEGGPSSQVVADASGVSDGGGDGAADIGSAVGNKEKPDYAKVFATDKVHELAIELTAAAAAAQEADLTELLGAIGTGTAIGGGPAGGPGGGEMPPELATACAGKAVGETCSLSIGGASQAGKCTAGQGGATVCLPDGMGGPGGGGPGGPGGGGPGGAGGLSLTTRDPMYVSASIRADGQLWEHVGMRYKGNSSLMSSWQQGIRKLPFRLDFNKYSAEFPATKGQRYFGFGELTFASNWSDASYSRELLAGEMFRDRGVPAARAAFYRVTLDKGDGKGPIYMGLYTAVEDPSDVMMAQVYGDDSGNLYKPDGTAAAWTKFDAAAFEKKNNIKAADFSDIQAAVAALHADRTDAAKWRAGLEKTLNVEAYLKHLAVNSAIVNWDSYGQMAHNYYLYAVPSDGKRLNWIPWDFNLSMQPSTTTGAGKAAGMGTGLSLSLSEVSSSWPLIRFLLDDPTYRASYRQYLALAVQSGFESATFAKRVQQLHDMIAVHVTGAKGEQAPYTTLSSASEFDAAVQVLADHAKARAVAVAAELAKP